MHKDAGHTQPRVAQLESPPASSTPCRALTADPGFWLLNSTSYRRASKVGGALPGAGWPTQLSTPLGGFFEVRSASYVACVARECVRDVRDQAGVQLPSKSGLDMAAWQPRAR